MTKYIFVGDIHGKVHQVERALAKEGKKIFVGDFMDSFDRPFGDHRKCLNLVIEAIRNGEAEAIYGNHELSYIFPHHRCSGWTAKNAETMEMFGPQIKELFKSFIFIKPNILVTHAGLTKQIWDTYELSQDTLCQFLTDGWAVGPGHPTHWIGRYRGGRDIVGGTFWCDWNAEFLGIPGITQIFGHTAGMGIRQSEQSFCIDCLDREHSFLELEFDD